MIQRWFFFCALLALQFTAEAQTKTTYTTFQYSTQLNYFGQNHIGSVGNMSQTNIGWNFAKLWTTKYSMSVFIGVHQREFLFPRTTNEDFADYALLKLIESEDQSEQLLNKALQNKKVFGGAARYQIGLQFYKAKPFLPQIELYAGQALVSVDLNPENQEFLKLQGWEKITHPFAGASFKCYLFNKGVYSDELPLFIGFNTEYSFPKNTRFQGESIENAIPGINQQWTKAWRIGASIGIGIL